MKTIYLPFTKIIISEGMKMSYKDMFTFYYRYFIDIYFFDIINIQREISIYFSKEFRFPR